MWRGADACAGIIVARDGRWTLRAAAGAPPCEGPPPPCEGCVLAVEDTRGETALWSIDRGGVEASGPVAVFLGLCVDGALGWIDAWAGAPPVAGERDEGPAFSLVPASCDGRPGLALAPRFDLPPDAAASAHQRIFEGPVHIEDGRLIPSADGASCRPLVGAPP